MTFHTREEVQDLFFHFKILVFKEINSPGKSGTGENIVEKSFEVIAQKLE